MCGLTGFWDKSLAYSQENLEFFTQAMADKIDHRGPDSSGIWCDAKSGIGLGHRRLSIVDLSPAGHQPMVSRSNRMMLAYNGEIYNTNELRNELIAAGISADEFSGYSDTEVILRACEIWGVEETCRKMIGMFAFALWDAKEQCLYLTRDRLGKKPMYWGFHGIGRQILFFGSQIKSFTPHPTWKPEIETDVLHSYFRFNYVPAPVSIFKGIHKLTPGTVLKIDRQNNIQETRFWDFQEVIAIGAKYRNHDQNNKHPLNDEEAIDALEELLKDAVKRRMMADVPLGAFLSGGVDSSTIVALMQAQSDRPVKTFSIGYQEQDYNEAVHAKKVAKHLGTEHHEQYLEPKQIFDIIPSIPHWFDEPFADSSQIPTYLVSKMAREHVTVALSGDGGDELFAGYTRYLQGQRTWAWMNAIPLWSKYLAATLIRSVKPRTWDVISKAIPKKIRPSLFSDKLYKMSDVLLIKHPEEFYKRLVSQWHHPNELVLQGKETLYFPWQGLKKDSNHLNNIVEYMQAMDTLSYLPDDILTKVDRASMALGLEARVPLLDHRVVEFAWRLPCNQKIRNNQGKWLLRQVLYRYVPKELIERPKMGFGIPIDRWLRTDLRAWAEELLYDNSLKSEGLLNTQLIHQRWTEHLSGTRNWQYPLWGVLMFLAWKKNWGF